MTNKDLERIKRFRKAYPEFNDYTDVQILDFLNMHKQIKSEIDNAINNYNRRARHEAFTDLGLKRVKGSLGGTYYE